MHRVLADGLTALKRCISAVKVSRSSPSSQLQPKYKTTIAPMSCMMATSYSLTVKTQRTEAPRSVEARTRQAIYA